MKYLLVFIISLSIYSATPFTLKEYQKKIKNINSIRTVVNNYKKDLFLENLRDFVACCRPTRMVGTESHDKATQWIVDKLKKIDSSASIHVDEFSPDITYAKKVYSDDFKKEIAGNYPKTSPIYIKWNRYTNSILGQLDKLKTVKGKNIVWEKKGSTSPEEVIVLGAHYDTINFDKEKVTINYKASQPGADNNGTGVASLISLIEILSKMDIPKTIRVVFLDYQEFGSLGARAYVDKYKETLRKEKFAGFVNLLMLGHDTKRNDKSNKLYNYKIYTRKKSNPLHGLDSELATQLSKSGDRATFGIRFDIDPSGFNRSDHISFWAEGFPAVTFTQNWEDDLNPNNHTSNDFIETLNFRSLDKAFRFISASILAWTYDII